VNQNRGLSAIAKAARRRWALCLLVGLPVVIGVGTYAQLAPAQYDAQTTVAFAPRPTSLVGGDVIAVVLPRYVSLLKAEGTIQSVSRQTDVPESVLESADVSIATDSANLLIVVRDTDPARAAEAANALASTVLTSTTDDDLLVAEQVDPAVAPEDPSAPPRSLLAVAGLIAGLVVAFAAAVAAERLRPHVRDEDDIATAGSLRALGRLPAPPDRLADRTLDPTAESAARVLVARTEHAVGAARVSVLGVTSPSGQHDRVGVALAYASVAAGRGRSVVLVEADPSRGVPDATDEVTPARDLADVSTDDAALDDLLHPGHTDGVLVLRPGPGPRGVGFLASRLPDVLERLRNRADLVVIECPAVSEDDAQVLLVQLPAIVLAVRAGTLATDLAAAEDTLSALQTDVLGVVLTDVQRPHGKRLEPGQQLPASRNPPALEPVTGPEPTATSEPRMVEETA